MKLAKCLALALNLLLHSKLRSWLTIIGIVIGVAAVVAIVSIGEGMQQSVQSNLGGLGADLISISPGGGRASAGFRGMPGHGGMGPESGAASSSQAKDLTLKDIQQLKTIENVQFVQGVVSGRGEAYYLGEKSTVSVTGVDPLVWQHMTTSELETGRFINPADYNVVVVGSRIAERTFKQPLLLNSILTIEGKSFKIVGILKESGGFGGEDNSIIMPIKAARDTLEDVGEEEFDSITLKASNTDAVDQIIEDIDRKLMLSRRVTERTKDYRISSAKAMQENISEVTGTMTMFLAAIAAVSLLVGAVGVANTMFTSVLEKTKDIGIMKAIGAKNRDIMLIFLLNSGLVGLTGGIFGIALGAVLSTVFQGMLVGIQLPGAGRGGQLLAVITPRLLFYSLTISLGVGILAGAIPAYRASKLKPVDALRYE